MARVLREQREYQLAGQVLRAGTSIGANVEEALAGVSRPDFIAKMGVASKEARETHYWLRLLRDSRIVPSSQIASTVEEADVLLRILTAIVKMSQNGKRVLTKNSKLTTKNSKDGPYG